MSSDKHSSSPRHSRASPLSSASVDVNSTAALSSTHSTTAQPSQTSISRSQSSNVLSGGVEQTTVDDDTSASAPFEDKSLWSKSFGVLYEFYRTGTFCDVEIHVGSRRINCHRLVLACFSQYFRYCTQLLLSLVYVMFNELIDADITNSSLTQCYYHEGKRKLERKLIIFVNEN